MQKQQALPRFAMAIVEHSETDLCRHCGSPYRRPSWGREYLCPSCSQPLTAAQKPRRSLGAIRPLAYGVLTLVLGTGLFRVASERLAQNRSLARSAPEAVEPVRLPPDFAARLQDKLRFFDADLATDPNHSYLLNRAGETALSLALLHRDTDPKEASRWRRRAQEYLRRAKRIRFDNMERDLERRIERFERLQWGTFGSRPASPMGGRFIPQSATGGQPTITSNPWATSSSGRPPIGYPAPRGGYPGGGYPGVGHPGGGYPGGGYPGGGYPGGGYPGSGYPGSGSPFGGYSSGGYPGAGYPAALPQVMPSMGSLPPRASSPAPESALDRARRELQAKPNDPVALWRVANLLEYEARLPSRRSARLMLSPAREAQAREAIRLYQRSAQHSRLRSERATCYHDIARLYRRLNQDQREYEYLHRAIQEAPGTAAFWEDLRNVCIRLGLTQESQRAAAQVRRWSLPTPVLSL